MSKAFLKQSPTLNLDRRIRHLPGPAHPTQRLRNGCKPSGSTLDENFVDRHRLPSRDARGVARGHTERLVGESTDPKTRGWEHEDHRHVSFCPSARKPTTSPPTMTLKLIASVAFLLCARSLAFVAVVPPGGVACVSGTTGVPAVSSKTSISTISDSATAAAGLQHNGSKPRRSRCWPSLLITSSSKSKSSTPENNVAPANGLTTSTEEKQTGGGGRGREGRLHLESDIFVPEPGSTSLEAALTGSPHFGDIMGGGGSGADLIKGRQGGGLLQHFDAMERVVLTANGNLQRVISSYYNSPVKVDITYCEEVEPSVYEREVEISIFGSVFCVAKSLVVLHSPVCAEAVKTGTVGIGQLFRSLDILPSFELLNAGYRTRPRPPLYDGKDNAEADGSHGPSGAGGGGTGEAAGGGGEGGSKGGLWRVYDLRSQHVSCRIHEEFVPGLFGLLEGGENRKPNEKRE